MFRQDNVFNLFYKLTRNLYDFTFFIFPILGKCYKFSNQLALCWCMPISVISCFACLSLHNPALPCLPLPSDSLNFNKIWIHTSTLRHWAVSDSLETCKISPHIGYEHAPFFFPEFLQLNQTPLFKFAPNSFFLLHSH